METEEEKKKRLAEMAARMKERMVANGQGVQKGVQTATNNPVWNKLRSMFGSK